MQLHLIPSPDKFIGQNLAANQMPAFFSFQSDEIRYGFLALSKWSKEAGGKETAGVVYEDINGNMRFRHITIGTKTVVGISIQDLSHKSVTDVRKELSYISSAVEYSKSDRNSFVLLPESFNDDVSLIKGVIFEKGKKIYGSTHVHPSDNPPNGVDLALLIFARTDNIKGVITGDKHYLMVTTKDTPNYDILPSKDNKSSTMHDYGYEIDRETRKLISSGIPTQAAIMQSLIKYCQLNSVTLYEGDLETNIYRKIE